MLTATGIGGLVIRYSPGDMSGSHPGTSRQRSHLTRLPGLLAALDSSLWMLRGRRSIMVNTWLSLLAPDCS